MAQICLDINVVIMKHPFAFQVALTLESVPDVIAFEHCHGNTAIIKGTALIADGHSYIALLKVQNQIYLQLLELDILKEIFRYKLYTYFADTFRCATI